jgi:DNA (cytosine-5)-methyltransferase 1
VTHGSLFSGIGGFDLGFERAGFHTLWAVEKEPFCRAVLATHFPETELLNDVHDCGRHNLRAVDVITAGFPCQDLSVAGKRAGLAGTRSGLFWQVVRILGECRPPWFVLENVPGLFSSNEGRDFATVLNELDELGYGLAWRVLDSQFFGVAQRRRRVFIVGRFGAPCPAEVLFEPESGTGDFAESGETREDVATETARCLTGTCWKRHDEDTDTLIAATITSRHSPNGHGAAGTRVEDIPNLVACLGTFSGGPDDNDAQAGHIVIQDARGQRDKRQNGIGITEGGPCYTLDGTSEHAVAFSNRGNDSENFETLRSDCNGALPMVAHVSAPPDADGMRDFAELPEGMDSPRYRALGNAVTQEVAYWIANRIKPYLTGAL